MTFAGWLSGICQGLGLRFEGQVNTLHSIFSKFHKLSLHKGTYGIEIETETEGSSAYPNSATFFNTKVETTPQGYTKEWYDIPSKYWKGLDDGSLRDFGIEYVLRKPELFGDALVALNEFRDVMVKDGKPIAFLQGTPSTSVHVHVNMLNELPITLANFITTWLLFENVLTEYCGEGRRSNLFAPPVRVVEGAWINYLKMFKLMEEGKPSAIKWPLEKTKYAALNIATLCTLGSVEARCMRGTTDVEEIKEWLGIINKIYLYSKTPGRTPMEIYKSFQKYEYQLLQIVFGEYAKVLMKEGWQDGIERNLFYVGKLACCVKDWKTFGLAYFGQSEKFKKAQAYLMEKYGFSTEQAANMLMEDPDMIDAYINEMALQKKAKTVKKKLDLSNAPQPWMTVSPGDIVHGLQAGANLYAQTQPISVSDLPDFDEDI